MNSTLNNPAIFTRMLSGIGQVWRHYRFLLHKLTVTSLTLPFKKSFLGAAWLFIQPVIVVLAWVLLHGAGLFDPGATGVPYPAYVLLSTSIWSLFTGLYQHTSQMLVGNAQVIMQHQFPREVFILEKMAVALFQFLIPFALSVLVLLLYGVGFTWHVILFPLAIIPLVLFGSALGILFAMIKAVTSDLTNFFDKAINLVMYITPVVYAADMGSPLLASIIRWNPLTYLLAFPRDLLVGAGWFAPVTFLWVSVASALFFLGTLWYFRKVQPLIMERMIA